MARHDTQLIVAYLDSTLDTMVERPALWGALPCVELQVLRLLEVRLIAVRRGSMEETNEVAREWRAFLSKMFSNWSGGGLLTCVEGDEAAFASKLSEFCKAERLRQGDLGEGELCLGIEPNEMGDAGCNVE